MTALSSGSLLHIWTSCLKAWCPHGCVVSARHWEFWWLGTVLFSVGSCFTHRDAQALLENPEINACLKVQPCLSALRTPKEGSFLLREITTNLQGPQYSEVLSPSAHSFIHFLSNTVLTETCLQCAKCYLIYSIAITKTDIVFANLTVGEEKVVDYNGEERVLESTHPLGLPHSQQPWVSKFLNLCVPQTNHL